MSDKSNKYGYITDVDQARGNNKGVFSVNEIYDLVKAQQFTGQYSSLELIETKELINSVGDFLSIGTYNVHLLVWSDIELGSDANSFSVRLSSDGGTTFRSSGYRYKQDWFTTTNSQVNSNSSNIIIGDASAGNSTNERTNGYMWLYNVSDTEATFTTNHSVFMHSGGTQASTWGMCGETSAIQNNAIRVLSSGGTSTLTGYVSLYGLLKEAK